MIPDFTAATIATLETLAQNQASGKYPTVTEVRTILSTDGGSTKSIPAFQAVTLAAGVAVIERRAQTTFVTLATEGGAFSDEMASITGTGFNKGDYLVIYLSQTGRTITTGSTGNVSAQGFTWIDQDSFICLQYTGTRFNEAFRFPAMAGISTRPQSAVGIVISGTGVRYITTPTSWAVARWLDPTTETLATATFTITGATGTAGTYRVVVDNGSGVGLTIGETVYSTATSNNAEATAMGAAINALTVTTGYTATVLGAVVTISAPVGTGSAANVYTLGAEVTGGAAAGTVNFSAGVDAAEAASNLAEIYPEISGMELLLTNGMSAAAITLIVGGNIAASAAGALAAMTSIRLIFDPVTLTWIPS